jgi:AcrR family transcriptional regulator
MVRPRLFSDAEILQVARRCFLEHGPAVSTTVIASEVGLSQAALFKRFGTKQNLMLLALMPHGVPAWIVMVEAGPDERPIPEQLHDIAMCMTEFFSEMIPCISTLRAAADVLEVFRDQDAPPPIRGRQALATWFVTAQQQGRVRAADPLAMAQTLIGALHGRAFMNHLQGAEHSSAEAFVDDLLDVLWNGIGPQPLPTQDDP